MIDLPPIITAQYRGTCDSCEDVISVGDRIRWDANARLKWHAACPLPRSLAIHQRAGKQRTALGIDTPEFGRAPMLKEREPETRHPTLEEFMAREPERD